MWNAATGGEKKNLLVHTLTFASAIDLRHRSRTIHSESSNCDKLSPQQLHDREDVAKQKFRDSFRATYI